MGSLAASADGVVRGVVPLRGMFSRQLLLTPSGPLGTPSAPLTEAGTRGLGIGPDPIIRILSGSTSAGTVTLEGGSWEAAGEIHTTLSGATGDTAATGFAHGPLSATSPATLVQTSGVLQLVTPNRVTVGVLGLGSQVIGHGASLRIRFLPEPHGLALWCGVAAAFAWMGWRRRHSAAPRNGWRPR